MIRTAHADELPEFAKQWARTLLPETRPVDDLGPFVQLGPKRGHGVHRKFLLTAMQSVCSTALDAHVDVIDHQGVPLAWCAWMPPDEHPLTIRFIHVADLVRRRGFGSMLLRHVLGHRDDRPARLTCITSSGAALFRAVAAPTREQHAGTDDEQRVVEARG